MGEKPTASRRAATQKRKEHAAGTAPGAGPPREPMSDAEQQEQIAKLLSIAQDTKSQSMTWVGLMCLAAAAGTSYCIVLQLHEPWSVDHFAQLKPVVSSFELILGLMPSVIAPVLIGIAVAFPRDENFLVLSRLAWVVSAAGAIGWAIAFAGAKFFSFWHLWLPGAPVALVASSAMSIYSAVSAEKEILELAEEAFGSPRSGKEE
ncbi:hypothetical protein FNF29_02096 [Cafeteria roenbergensis]|uniref:Uncharacterized protein n=1 Tax=Cafeteria roenbergensis TaxID=33653 RepID=A0A5A8DI56_CAFRO|nr:hypothetical protein FNF29_02096 [Cafeteria roenbergensis]KAA0165075.1 hypothetical protein FNF31_02088 [Cafeteria roenbergensis]KAA0170175.1 hypothetical protein FNF28_01596 [Cafeteria roenbergensis]|eukprot:KAA0154952.1 hypothetical protein FNF29_02096 [Cafeteria roenbergensis]